MIARLRARHRWMWIALLIVAPGVLAAALSVRRAEAVRQDVAAELESESPAVPLHEVLVQQPAPLWPRDPSSGRRVIELDSVVGPITEEPDLLLYWSAQAAASGSFAWQPTEPPRPLPSDAVFIAAWVPGRSHRFFVPDDIDERTGNFVWYSTAHASVVFVPGGRVAMSVRSEPPR